MVEGGSSGKHGQPMDDRGGLPDLSDDGTGRHGVPHLAGGDEVPLLLRRERSNLDARSDEPSARLLDLLQGPLDPVVDRTEKPGAEVHGERPLQRVGALPDPHARVVFVDLDGRGISLQTDDLPDQALGADLHDVIQPAAPEARGLEDGTVDPGNLAFDHFTRLFPEGPPPAPPDAPPGAVQSPPPAWRGSAAGGPPWSAECPCPAHLRRPPAWLP